METTLECLDSLLSIKAALNGLSNSIEGSHVSHVAPTNDSIVQLRSAHNQLVQSLVQLRKCHAQSADYKCDMNVGSLVLAPRYFHGTICNDLAIVVQVEALDEPQALELESEVVYDTKVIWLRPMSAYEMNSPGIKFSKSQLINNGLEYYDMQNQHLNNIRLNDNIFVKSVQELWCECVTQRIDEHKNEICVLLKSNVIQTTKLDIFNTAPFPRSYLKMQKSKDSKRNLVVEDTITFNSELHTSSSRLPYSDIPIKIGFDEIVGFGSWEVHTKRFGSKMLGELLLSISIEFSLIVFISVKKKWDINVELVWDRKVKGE